MKALTDNPVEKPNDDQYGFRPYAAILAQMILDTDNLPFCMGVYGAWGTGKSSLMRLIECKIMNDINVKTLWFNPWKYQRREELWSALIRSVLSCIEKNGEAETKQMATTLMKGAAWSLIKKAAGSLTMGVVTGDDLENLKESITTSEKEYQQYLNSFEDDFSRLVSKYTNEGKLVLFIDDLDRCLPENAITVLESLKLFIGHARCIFVLGMDKAIVEMGIQKIYGEQIRFSGRDYLDKIIQVPFYIPPVQFDKLRDSLIATKTVEYQESIWKILEFGMVGNPRKTKRFVNSFYLLRSILSAPAITSFGYEQGDPIESASVSRETQDIYLAKLLAMQLAFQKFYEYLAINPSGWKIIERNIIKGNGDLKKAALADYAELRKFTEDMEFMHFMEMTSSNPDSRTPQAPEPDVVSRLLRAIDLVSDSSSSSAPEPRDEIRQSNPSSRYEKMSKSFKTPARRAVQPSAKRSSSKGFKKK